MCAVERVADGGRIPAAAALRGGTRSALSPFAIAARLLPAARSRPIRSIAYGDIVGGRPSRTPCARLSASACRVRCEISPRSNWAKLASTFTTASPAGVLVSSAQSRATSAQPCFCALATRQASSSSEREGVSSFLARSAFASPSSEHPQRLLEAGTLQLLGREAGLLDDLEQLPAAPLARRRATGSTADSGLVDSGRLSDGSVTASRDGNSSRLIRLRCTDSGHPLTALGD